MGREKINHLTWYNLTADLVKLCHWNASHISKQNNSCHRFRLDSQVCWLMASERLINNKVIMKYKRNSWRYSSVLFETGTFEGYDSWGIWVYTNTGYTPQCDVDDTQFKLWGEINEGVLKSSAGMQNWIVFFIKTVIFWSDETLPLLSLFTLSFNNPGTSSQKLSYTVKNRWFSVKNEPWCCYYYTNDFY